MNFEEMQTVWSDMSDQLEQQKKLTDRLILDMTKEKFKNRFGGITFYETIGAIVCFAIAIGLFANFQKLDTWYLELCGAFTLIYLVALPIVSLRSIKRMKSIDIDRHSYKEALSLYTKRRRTFLLIQQFAIASSFILMFATVPVASKLIGNKDIFLMDGTKWIWYFVVMTIFLVFFTRWAYRCYKSITASATTILKELEN